MATSPVPQEMMEILAVLAVCVVLNALVMRRS